MAAERWLLITIALAMAFHGIGLEEDVRSIMEAHTRAMIEEARRSDQETITRLAQQLTTMSTSSRGTPPPAQWQGNFLDEAWETRGARRKGVALGRVVLQVPSLHDERGRQLRDAPYGGRDLAR